MARQRRGRIAVERRADLGRDAVERDILGVEHAAAIGEMVHGQLRVGERARRMQALWCSGYSMSGCETMPSRGSAAIADDPAHRGWQPRVPPHHLSPRVRGRGRTYPSLTLPRLRRCAAAQPAKAEPDLVRARSGKRSRRGSSNEP